MRNKSDLELQCEIIKMQNNSENSSHLIRYAVICRTNSNENATNKIGNDSYAYVKGLLEVQNDS